MGVRQGRSERRGESYFLLYVESLSDARTLLAGFFSSLLDRLAHFEIGRLGLVLRLLFGLRFPVPVKHPMTVRASMEILRAFDFGDQLGRNLKTAT